jgi:hypothetical protein
MHHLLLQSELNYEMDSKTMTIKQMKKKKFIGHKFKLT